MTFFSKAQSGIVTALLRITTQHNTTIGTDSQCISPEPPEATQYAYALSITGEKTFEKYGLLPNDQKHEGIFIFPGKRPHRVGGVQLGVW